MCSLSLESELAQLLANALLLQGDEMPPDILDKWMEREDAELAAKAGAGETPRAASK